MMQIKFWHFKVGISLHQFPGSDLQFYGFLNTFTTIEKITYPVDKFIRQSNNRLQYSYSDLAHPRERRIGMSMVNTENVEQMKGKFGLPT